MGLSRWLALRTCGGGPLVSWIARDLCRSNRHREGPEPPGSVPSPNIEAIFRGPLLTIPNNRRRWHHGDSPLMLATLLALPRSGSNRYTLRRRGEKYLPKYPRSRWRRWRFFGILLPAPFCLFPRSRTTEHRRNEFSLLLYRQSRATRLFLSCRLHVITVSRRRDPPRITHQRRIGELDNNYDWERLRRNAVTINIKKHCVDETQADHRSPFRSGRRTRRKEEEYIHIYIYVYV